MPVLEILEQKLSVNKFQYIKSKLSPLEIDFNFLKKSSTPPKFESIIIISIK